MPRELKPGDFVRVIRTTFSDPMSWGDDKGFLGVVEAVRPSAVSICWVGVANRRDHEWTYYSSEIEYVSLDDLTGEECALLMKEALTCPST